MLSPLQERVAEIIAGLKEAEGFALAGGAALIVRGDVRHQPARSSAGASKRSSSPSVANTVKNTSAISALCSIENTPMARAPGALLHP